MNYPNIFKYATSELSQDAFLCWLIACAGSEANSQAKEVGRKFIVFLYNQYVGKYSLGGEDCVDVGRGLISLDDIVSVNKTETQSEKIDVFFSADILRKGVAVNIAFIIEDKTNSFPHSKQLKRYVDAIKTRYPKCPIVKIYYKTGGVVAEDVEACVDEQAQYKIISADDMYEFLEQNSMQHTVYNDYKSYLYDKYLYPQSIKLKKYKNGEVGALKSRYIQSKFMNELSTRCRGGLGGRKIRTGIESGGNNSWAQFRFICFRNIYRDVNEYVFYRIEWVTNKPVLTVRQYAKFDKSKPDLAKKKTQRLNYYKRLYEEAMKLILDEKDVERPRKDRKGAYSSQIAKFTLVNDGVYTISFLLDKIPIIHQKFVESLNSSDKFIDQ